MKKSSEPWTHK